MKVFKNIILYQTRKKEITPFLLYSVIETSFKHTLSLKIFNINDLQLSCVKNYLKTFHFKIKKPVKTSQEAIPTTTTTTPSVHSITQGNPGSSCKSIKEQFGNSASSGLYWIDLSPATQVYCDMDTDGVL